MFDFTNVKSSPVDSVPSKAGCFSPHRQVFTEDEGDNAP